MKTDVVILSCDKYSDLWEPFFKLYNKYWKDNPFKTYLITENRTYPGVDAINTHGQWTERIRIALEKLNSKYVIIMLDDFFIREAVDTKRILECIDNFTDNTANFNFELDYNENPQSDIQGFNLKHSQASYKCSCQAGVWDREKLIELLHGSRTAWEWELQGTDKTYDFYINNTDYIINYGYSNHEWFGVCKGKWVARDIKPLFEREGIEINLEQRGCI